MWHVPTQMKQRSMNTYMNYNEDEIISQTCALSPRSSHAGENLFEGSEQWHSLTAYDSRSKGVVVLFYQEFIAQHHSKFK